MAVSGERALSPSVGNFMGNATLIVSEGDGHDNEA
jgi:hypothetical protein